jgi:hypothetical protein
MIHVCRHSRLCNFQCSMQEDLGQWMQTNKQTHTPKAFRLVVTALVSSSFSLFSFSVLVVLVLRPLSLSRSGSRLTAQEAPSRHDPGTPARMRMRTEVREPRGADVCLPFRFTLHAWTCRRQRCELRAALATQLTAQTTPPHTMIGIRNPARRPIPGVTRGTALQRQ